MLTRYVRVLGVGCGRSLRQSQRSVSYADGALSAAVKAIVVESARSGCSPPPRLSSLYQPLLSSFLQMALPHHCLHLSVAGYR
ncbi:hypothetical protein Tco_0900500 [Tanacetum coccineum]|uniref:Uncharacterized protein n=1 Tax=Tanacetum coccineum TaxID=301880 RepID=A0ABQ5CWV4_9ASTR